MAEEGQSPRSDLWGGAGWVVFGLLIVVGSWRMDRFESMGAELYTMPGFVPGMIGGLVALLGLVLMLRGWLRQRTETGEKNARPAQPLLNRRIVVTTALSLLYAGLLLGRAPFWLVTALYVAAFVALFSPAESSPMRRTVVAVVAGVLASAAVTLVFEQLFLVRLP